MFQDIGVSKDLNEQFRRHLNETLSNEPLDIDFQIQVKLLISFCIKGNNIGHFALHFNGIQLYF